MLQSECSQACTKCHKKISLNGLHISNIVLLLICVEASNELFETGWSISVRCDIVLTADQL